MRPSTPFGGRICSWHWLQGNDTVLPAITRPRIIQEPTCNVLPQTFTHNV
jgi:hypothetical protein